MVRLDDVQLCYLTPGECLVVRTVNSTYHFTRRVGNTWFGDGGSEAQSLGRYPLPVAIIGDTFGPGDWIRFDNLRVGNKMVMVRGSDMRRIFTSPIGAIEFHPSNHGRIEEAQHDAVG